VNSSVLEDRFAIERRSDHSVDRAFAPALGACPRLGGTGLLAQDWAALAAGKLSVPRATMAVDTQITPPTYNHMTRIAAAGGSVSGSPPAWDPV
jgi:hypothetical protein